MNRIIALTLVSLNIFTLIIYIIRKFSQILLVLQTWKKVQAGTLDRFSGSGNGGNIQRKSFDPNLSFDVFEGKYVDNESKWKYKPDSRGKYVHVPNPYNGKQL